MTAETMKVKIKEDATLLSRLAGKALAGMQKVTGRFDPLIDVPVVGSSFAEVQDIVYMLSDYYEGKYTKIPMSAMIGCVAIIGYVACPIDLIPDNIPILGFLDDAFIIKLIIDICVDKELKDYRKWRKENINTPVIEAETV